MIVMVNKSATTVLDKNAININKTPTFNEMPPWKQ